MVLWKKEAVRLLGSFVEYVVFNFSWRSELPKRNWKSTLLHVERYEPKFLCRPCVHPWEMLPIFSWKAFCGATTRCHSTHLGIHQVEVHASADAFIVTAL